MWSAALNGNVLLLVAIGPAACGMAAVLELTTLGVTPSWAERAVRGVVEEEEAEEIGRTSKGAVDVLGACCAPTGR